MRPPKQLLSGSPSQGSNTTAATHGSSGNATATERAGNPWGPFGNAATYRADMAIAVAILLAGFLLGLLLMLTVRFSLCRRRRAPPADDPDQKPGGRGCGAAEEVQTSKPPTVYSAGKTELAGAAAECAICLTDFVDGDGLRVLPVCRHGFHVECVERWLASSAGSSRAPARPAAAPSCPVCRASCRPPASSPENEP